MFLTAQGLALIAPGGSVLARPTLETVRGGEEAGQPQCGEDRGSWAACLPSRRIMRSGLTLVSPPARGCTAEGVGFDPVSKQLRSRALQGPEQLVLAPQGDRVPSRAVAQGPHLLGRWLHLWLSGPKHFFFREDEARAYGRPGCQPGQPPRPPRSLPSPTPTPHPHPAPLPSPTHHWRP